MDSAPFAVPDDDPLFHYAIISALGSFLFALISYNFVDIDLWHEMALIRESVSAGHLITTDAYAYTPTKGWVDHEWGAGLVAYFSMLWLGGRSLIALKFLLAAGTGYCGLRCAGLIGTDVRLLAMCAPLPIVLAHLGFFTVIRAQAYSFFFTALLLLLLQLDRRGVRAWEIVWLLVFPLWVNLHGGFVVGLGLLGLHTVEQIVRRSPYRHLLAILAGMCLEVFLNPYGTAYLRYLGHALTMARPYIPEWRPIWDLGPVWTISFLLAVVTALYALASNGWRGMPGILPLTAAAAEATLHRKLLPFFAVAWLCYVPASLQKTEVGEWLLGFVRRRRGFWLIASVAFAFVCCIASAEQKFWRLSVPQPIYPVGPVTYLAEQKFHGNLLVPFRLGSYVSWKLFPAVKVSLDSRYEEVYPDRVVRDVFGFFDAGSDWRSVLTSYPTDLVLVPKDSPVWEKMRHSDWTRVYLDREFELYAKPGTSLVREDWTYKSFDGVFP